MNLICLELVLKKWKVNKKKEAQKNQKNKITIVTKEKRPLFSHLLTTPKKKLRDFIKIKIKMWSAERF